MLPFKHNIYDSAVLTVYNLLQFISKTCFDSITINYQFQLVTSPIPPQGLHADEEAQQLA